MVKFLTYALVDLNELDKFLIELKNTSDQTPLIQFESSCFTYNLLFLLKLGHLMVQLLKPLLQLFLVFQNGHFILFLNG